MGGAFSCVPNATSLSRSLLQEQTGGRTQVASVVSSFLILIILLWFAPFFEVLPRVKTKKQMKKMFFEKKKQKWISDDHKIAYRFFFGFLSLFRYSVSYQASLWWL